MKLKIKNLSKSAFAGVLLSLTVVSPAFAHVVVKPGEVTTGTYTTFTVSVPNEKDSDTVELRLSIPESLESVTPTVKSGWKISTQSPNPEASERIDSITWSGGKIPKGQRDDFTFSTKTPSEPTELTWKAYQVYADGVTVAWDKSGEEQADSDDATSGPFSVTKVVSTNESVEASSSDQSAEIDDLKLSSKRATYVAIAAIVVALISLMIASNPKKK